MRRAALIPPHSAEPIFKTILDEQNPSIELFLFSVRTEPNL